MNILIIGGTGVLSSAVVKESIKRGIGVTMINRGKRKSLIPDGVELLIADKDDKRRIQSLLGNRNFDAVMDYLCYTDKETESSFKFYSQYTKQYFFISSCAVYNTSLGGVCKEDAPKVLPIWKYSVNKWKSEQFLVSLATNTDVNYTIVRPCITYGDTRIPYGIAPKYGYHWTLVARMLNGKPLIRWNGGRNRANMLRVEDFAVGVVGLIGNTNAYNEAFNICGDETPSFNDVLDELANVTQVYPKIVDIDNKFYANKLPHLAGEILGGRSIDTLNSNEKIKRVVPNFHQNIFLKEGILKTYNAYLDNNYQLGIDWKFEGETDKVIKEWCKQQHIDTNGMNLRFVDYLNNARFQDRLTYYIALHTGRLDAKLLSFSLKVIQKLQNVLFKS